MKKLLITIILFIPIFLDSGEIFGLNELSEYKVVTIKNDTLLFEQILDKDYVIIFYNKYSCFDCFKKIINNIDNKKKKIVFLVRENNNIINRRKDIEIIKEHFKSTMIYFDYHRNLDPWPPENLKTGLFGFFKIEKTPAVLLLSKNKILFYSYENLKKINYKIY